MIYIANKIIIDTLVEIIHNKLDKINQDIECNYKIRTFVEFFSVVLEHIEPENRIKALIILCKQNPTLNELNTWKKDDIKNYMLMSIPKCTKKGI